MGSSQSRSTPVTGTPYHAQQSYRAESAIGRFSLTSKQTFNLQVLSDILVNILKENNLFNLSDVLGKNNGCNSLFIMLSSKLNKEFSTLRFPEPGKQTLQTVSFIPKKTYEAAASTDVERKSNCSALIFFILRFVAFLSASVASVTINDQILTLLRQTDFEALYAPPIDKRFRNIDFSKQQLPPFVPLPMNILSLVANKQRLDSRYLFTIGNDATVVIDALRGVVYYGQKNESPVLGITITEASSTGANTNTRYNRKTNTVALLQPALPQPALPQPAPPSQGYLAQTVPQQAPPPQVYPALKNYVRPQAYPALQDYSRPVLQQAYPALQNYSRPVPQLTVVSQPGYPALQNYARPVQQVNPAIENYVAARPRLQGGRTRKRRNQRGGTNGFKVKLRKFGADCFGGDCVVSTFYMDDQGNTYDIFPRPGVSSIPFAARVISVLDTTGLRKIPTVEETDTKTTTEFTPITKLDDDSYAKIKKTIHKIVGDKASSISPDLEGTSPAFYRAFVLASEIEPSRFKTLVCSDIWERKRLTDIVSYSLLQSLYHDLEDGKMSSKAIADCTETVGKFVTDKVVTPLKSVASATPSGFESVEFMSYPSLRDFCKKTSPSHIHTIDTAAQQQILKSAYDELRKLYDTHLEATIRLLQLAFHLEDIGYKQEPRIVLNDIFIKHPQGAQVALEEIIAKGRKMISEHYLQVEHIYKGALQKLTA